MNPIAYCRGRVSAHNGCSLLPVDLRDGDAAAWRAGYLSELREPRIADEMSGYTYRFKVRREA